jgi:hypothetical protein
MNEEGAQAQDKRAMQVILAAESGTRGVGVGASVRAGVGVGVDTTAFDSILFGPPSSGKTEAILRTIHDRPMVRPGTNPCDANVFVVHYAAIADAYKRAKNMGVRNLFCVRKPPDFKRLAPSIHAMANICVVCKDAMFNRLCDHLHGVTVQRLVIDDIESIRVKNYNMDIHCNFKWFLTADLERLTVAHKIPRVKSTLLRETRSALAHGRVTGLEHTPPKTIRDMVVVNAENNPRNLNATISAIYTKEENHLAEACLPCENVRRCDIDMVYRRHTCEKLRDACPICFEQKQNVARIVTPCCENNSCAECFAKNAMQNDACRMCRQTIDLQNCTCVSSVSVTRMGSIVQELKNQSKTASPTRSPGSSRSPGGISSTPSRTSCGTPTWTTSTYAETTTSWKSGSGKSLTRRAGSPPSATTTSASDPSASRESRTSSSSGSTSPTENATTGPREASDRTTTPCPRYSPWRPFFNRTFNVFDEFKIYS